MTSVHALCHEGLEQAWETMGKYRDRHTKEPLKYSVGNLVMLNGKNLKTRRPSKNLDAKLHGPSRSRRCSRPWLFSLSYRIDGVFTMHSIYHSSNLIDLPPTLPDLNQSLLQPARRMSLVMMLMATSTKQALKLKKLLAASIPRNGNGFYIWSSGKGYPEEADWTEEPYENFDDKRLSMEYHRWNPQSAKDNRIKWLS